MNRSSSKASRTRAASATSRLAGLCTDCTACRLKRTDDCRTHSFTYICDSTTSDPAAHDNVHT